MKNRFIYTLIIIMMFLSACIPENKQTIRLVNGDRITIVNNNRSGITTNLKDMVFKGYYYGFEYAIPFEIATDKEKNQLMLNYLYSPTYDNSEILSAKENNKGKTIYYWLIPVKTDEGDYSGYWISVKADFDEIGIKEFMLGIEDKDGVQSDDISWCITAYLKE